MIGLYFVLLALRFDEVRLNMLNVRSGFNPNSKLFIELPVDILSLASVLTEPVLYLDLKNSLANILLLSSLDTNPDLLLSFTLVLMRLKT